ncbi:hypothetical protein [Haliscomenobacter hydrossis]|uniref:Uncharacterized protein n=1 Tax=Haliscomenobacter hydrossis (strain ATCC 27775 / DSM 1100 / LMG 10767 / O) TaxID=760192 RepID=F4KT61_HALH1|nr:hypothetical protein [Haliscomenobacter hydrossis]AEE50131.1 hypothetical protein Halhy_2251 [Haliscomenobacter hydrossis DSM 1100]
MELSDTYEKTLANYIKENKEFKIWTTSRVLPLIIDQVLRWGILFLYCRNFISLGLFISLQLFALTFITNLVIKQSNNSVKKKFQGKKIKNLTFAALPKKSSFYVLMFFIVLSWPASSLILMEFEFSSWFAKLIMMLLVILIVSIYQLGITVFSYSTNADSEIHFYPTDNNDYYCLDLDRFNELNGTSIESTDFKDISTEEIDKNDLDIVKMESKLQNMVNGVETYTLESIFIGTLSFSGFLTIVNSDKIQENINIFYSIDTKLIALYYEVINWHWVEAEKAIKDLTSGWNLFALIGIESLFCSALFIIVLALRIKFSTLIDRLNQSVKILNLFNSKEEELHLLKLQGVSNLDDRLSYLNKKIQNTLRNSKRVFKTAYPVFQYMGFSRNLGVICFYIILITSGLYFSNKISICIFAIIVLGYIAKILSMILDKQIIQKIVEKQHR